MIRIAEGAEKLAGGNVPVAMQPRLLFPASATGKDVFVLGIIKPVIVHARGQEARGRLSAALKGNHKGLPIPFMPHPTGVGGGIVARPPIGARRPQAGQKILVFALGKRGGLLNADDIIFDAEQCVDFLFMLIMAGNDPGTIRKNERARGRVKRMFQRGKNAPAKILKILVVGFAVLAQ